jgi:hypothetical protein
MLTYFSIILLKLRKFDNLEGSLFFIKKIGCHSN